MEKVLESMIEVAPVIKKIFDEKSAIVICDKETCLYSSDGTETKAATEKGKILDREILKKSGIEEVVFKNKKVLNTLLKKEIHGVDTKSIIIPILNEKSEVVGMLGINTNTEEYRNILSSTEELNNSLKETNSTVSEIASSAVKLSEKLNYMVDNTKATEKLIDESSQAVTLIESIAKQSNLLGLNAAIESSRAGEYGKGFSVVAGEMRKLALDSGESSKKISAALADMSDSMKEIIDTINELGEISTTQAASLEEVSATIEHISSNSEVLFKHINNN
ncbi:MULTISPECIES: methyl-accepting chemotaxis protein [Clostridium]|uniref:Methyl-accepting chemotaxis protein n=1 Tax=Clostridium saccharoperbutylacetonicum N1-4(HMT) TaxID=931276 RepID=M1MJY3_9CLOT|nr:MULTISPECIES: methyl-accepting chemotaxis protein [Clostridium]AGF56618.1 methyl-accepting chemotaxis protein [Clostridium saccharoperbutylacetonicum N1-4(HMT)]AQR95292.1 putative sensory transducer protein YfmS [Clostridium saccharoperbutylacetonicum]NRT62631.1 hypothetical protein [Clostridium saccharoperbutylacetonicum]NSB25978.1 hypothetical protein [Clostridium saccharoperbutylacetonicum]NSB31147.1 hypothetical protein [Clostridium saccharoperbutylacetonicum]